MGRLRGQASPSPHRLATGARGTGGDASPPRSRTWAWGPSSSMRARYVRFGFVGPGRGPAYSGTLGPRRQQPWACIALAHPIHRLARLRPLQGGHALLAWGERGERAELRPLSVIKREGEIEGEGGNRLRLLFLALA